MQDIIELQLTRFLLVYLLLLVIVLILKLSNINNTGRFVVASLRMTVQLIIAGLLLTYIFKNPHPLFTAGYIIMMIIFSVRRVYKKCDRLNKKFKIYVAICVSASGLLVLIFFIMVIVNESIFNPQYTIPISGMIIGNSMTGVILGINSFLDGVYDQKARISSLINIGVKPERVLKPMVSRALETAFLPILNSMVGMGIVSLPGMMTGQILAGTLPTTAILYQIAIVICIASAVVLTTFLTLNLGYRTLIDEKQSIII